MRCAVANDYSFKTLIEFLDYLGNKGLMNATSVATRKAACKKMLSILDDQEASDLRNLNIDDLASRFANLQGKEYKPESLQVYKSRTGSSLEHFIRYVDNPANFSIKTKQKTKNQAKKTSATPAPEKQSGEDTTASFAQVDDYSDKTINVPIALRPSCIVQMNGIPIDLTGAEAKKIANIILAMAPVEE